jgi:hypothetical protein
VRLWYGVDFGEMNNEMSEMRGMDDGFGHSHSEGKPPCKKKAIRVRESSSLRNDGVRRRADWPFLYIIEGGRTFINSAPRRKTARVEHEEEARW